MNVSILQKLVFPGTCTVLLNECVCLYWREVYNILKECKRLEHLALSFITRPGDMSDFRGLNICHLRYIDLSNSNLTYSFFEQGASSCKFLTVFVIQNSRGISQHTFNTSHIKQHMQLKILNVAHVPEALSLECILNMLEYSKSTVSIDIHGYPWQPFV